MRLFAHQLFFLATVLACSVQSCKDPVLEDDEHENSSFATPAWTDATHGKKASPNYEVVFADNEVKKLELRMTAADWASVKADMKALWGFDFGSATGGKPGGPGAFPTEEPAYVPVSLKLNDIEWYKVGFRLKGNSTLGNSWRSGIYKLPFRLNFDKYEDDYPQIEDQRFYGFKELSMSPGVNDNSLIREKLGSEIFRMAGIPSARAAFYRVYIDFGEGLKYCGVYTMVEVVDDTMIESQFGDDKGNIYKPESTLSSFIVSDFEKKNNEDVNDFSDVKAFVAALNSSIRTTQPDQWRANLEATFDVDHFTKWLAVNTTMVSWDTYGLMAHNYYLYNHPVKKLTWIPWDNNEVMMDRSMNGSALTLNLSTVTGQWPLIRYVADDPVYFARYKAHVKSFANDVFTVSKIQGMMDTYHQLISPYVIGPQEQEQGKYSQLSSVNAFTTALTTLKQHVVSRQQAVAEFNP